MFFGPRTTGVTSNVSGVGFGPLTPTSAWAMPLPTREAFGQAGGPPVSSVASSHFVRPGALSLKVFGGVIVELAQRAFSGSLFTISRLIFAFFGFFFVPAFFGVIFTVIVGAGVWARATAEKTSAVRAAMATIRYLRKGGPSNLD